MLSAIQGHLDKCVDTCDVYGTEVTARWTPHEDGLEIRFERVGGGGDEFGYDPMWDDDDDWTVSIPPGFEDDDDDEYETDFHNDGKNLDLGRVEEDSRSWVSSMMSDMGICPFTSGSGLAGLPMGKVRYETTLVDTPEKMYQRFWEEVDLLDKTPEKELSTTLLMCPKFTAGGDSNHGIDFFETFTGSLSSCLEAGVNMEDSIQLVFFHPQWTFRDGGDRSGAGGAMNYARRSPHPMINLLRTPQVRRGQKGIPTGLVYSQNEKTLMGIGADGLEEMLRSRDWSRLGGIKIDRSDYEALRVAKDMQENLVMVGDDGDMVFEDGWKGEAIDYASELREPEELKEEDRSQIEGGDLVTVLSQACEMRLRDGRLGSKETAVVAMAANFILADESLGYTD